MGNEKPIDKLVTWAAQNIELWEDLLTPQERGAIIESMIILDKDDEHEKQ